MPRSARKLSEMNIYHVMLRGVNRQAIFEERRDRLKFLDIVGLCKDVSQFELFAYCLMENHVHMLIRPSDQEPLSTVFRRVGIRYASWFNRKYNRVGHLFQDRYASEPIDSERYFLSCLRYILRNPVAAGICVSPFDYEFSSALEYMSENPGLTDTTVGLELIGRERFCAFANAECERKHLDVDDVCRKTDDDLRAVMKTATGCSNSSAFQRLDRTQRDNGIAALRRAGGSIRQVSRITGTSIGVVRKIS